MLPVLEKSILCLQNGNAAVERSLSDNKNTLTSERFNLLPESLVGLRRLKDHARKAGGAHCVSINDKMVDDMKGAYRLNQQRLIEEKNKEKGVIEKREKVEKEKQLARDKLKVISEKSIETCDKELDVKENEARDVLKV